MFGFLNTRTDCYKHKRALLMSYKTINQKKKKSKKRVPKRVKNSRNKETLNTLHRMTQSLRLVTIKEYY